jgi:hypothetical protein
MKPRRRGTETPENEGLKGIETHRDKGSETPERKRWMK